MTFSAVIIGLGSIGFGYDFDDVSSDFILTHTKALIAHNSFELIGAIELREEFRRKFKEKYNIPTYENLKLLPNSINPDVVIIAVPAEFHKATLDEVLSTWRPKAVLCEKPMSNLVSEAEQMVNSCELADVKLFVNYLRRADPAAIQIKNLLESKFDNNNLVRGHSWYSKGLLNNGSHVINLLEFWLGKVKGGAVLMEGNSKCGTYAEPQILVHLERGDVVMTPGWEEEFSIFSIDLLSKEGRVKYENGGEIVEWYPIEHDPIFSGYKKLKECPIVFEGQLNKYQMNVLIQLEAGLKGDFCTLCTGQQALETLRAIYKITNFRE